MGDHRLTGTFRIFRLQGVKNCQVLDRVGLYAIL